MITIYDIKTIVQEKLYNKIYMTETQFDLIYNIEFRSDLIQIVEPNYNYENLIQKFKRNSIENLSITTTDDVSYKIINTTGYIPHDIEHMVFRISFRDKVMSYPFYSYEHNMVMEIEHMIKEELSKPIDIYKEIDLARRGKKIRKLIDYEN